MKISVVITCYNYGKYIAGCIDSVLSQTYENFEIIVVNDGSTDDTGEVIKGFLSNAKISYIEQPNAGQANAKNNGIRHAKGELIAFLDADDIWRRTKLEKQIKLFSDPDIGVVYSRHKYIDSDGKVLDAELTGKHLQPRSGNVTGYLFYDNFVPFSSSIVRRKCLEMFGGFDESLSMSIDWDLWLKISTQFKFSFVDEPLMLYRVGHSGQMSRKVEERLQCADRVMYRFLSEYPGNISKKEFKDAMAFTFINRGYCYIGRDPLKSLYFYFKSLQYKPIQTEIFKGIIKNILMFKAEN